MYYIVYLITDVTAINQINQHIYIPPLVRVLLAQVLGHGVTLIIHPDLRLMTLDLGVGRESRLTDAADPVVVGA